MKFHLFLLAVFSLTFPSCDKAADLAEKARSKIESELAGKAGGGEADASLQKLVDQTSEGVLFRKDLPFPQVLTVKITRQREVEIRTFESSAIGSAGKSLKGTLSLVEKVERSGDQVRYTRDESTFREPLTEGSSNKEPVVRQIEPPSKPRIFRKSGETWKADNTEGFRTVALSRDLAPVFDQLLVDYALVPRPLWFGKRRFKAGDELVLDDKTLPMLISGNSKGSLTLKFEGLEAVDGHPCGVFSINGNFSRKQFPDFDANFTDSDVTVQSGKVWLSLIYPIVLREETDIIETAKTGQGGVASRSQGAIKHSLTRHFTPLIEPARSPEL
jgi:hypothetical protein